MVQVRSKTLHNDLSIPLPNYKILIINSKDGWLANHSSFFAYLAAFKKFGVPGVWSA